jgi:alanyl-tRNA synthetase
MVLGTHVQQKGSLVHPDYLRFDFSHFQKVQAHELRQIESMVNDKIRANIPLMENRAISLEEARTAGAMMLFGEKYGERVRMITFDPKYSRELCGGCHVPATGHIGLFKITTESAVAAGVRRIEAVTAVGAELYLHHELQQLEGVREALRQPKDLLKAIGDIQEQVRGLQRQVDKYYLLQAQLAKEELSQSARNTPNFVLYSGVVKVGSPEVLKKIAADLRQQSPPAVIVAGADIEGKAHLVVAGSDYLVAQRGLNAAQLIRVGAIHIQGGGGGQPFLATAGGTQPEGLVAAIQHILAQVEA